MTKLSFLTPQNDDDLVAFNVLYDKSLSSRALEAFSDFRTNPPVTIVDTMQAIQAQQLLRSSHQNPQVVVDSEDHFLGLITASDLNTQEILKKVSLGFNRNELSVKDFLRHKRHLKALNYRALERATIADLLDTLKGSREEFILVVDDAVHEIRGIISAASLTNGLSFRRDPPIYITKRDTYKH